MGFIWEEFFLLLFHDLREMKKQAIRNVKKSKIIFINI